ISPHLDIPFRGVKEEHLFHEFSRYGKIADFYFCDQRSYCLINYENRKSADDVFMYPVRINGWELRIRPRVQNQAGIEKIEALSQVLPQHEEVLRSIPKDKDFKKQVAEFLLAVCADENSLLKPFKVCEDLEKALKHLSANYKIIPFGSSVNGLALKDSDLDIYFGREPQTKGADVLDVFKKVQTILEKLPAIESINPIPSARVPIIKFVHKSTRLSCDLSFKNAMGVQNSKLIKFIVSLDERIKQFFIIVKYWAKLHHLTGRRFSNYALTLLLINFLQSLSEPFLPPLHELQHAGVVPIEIGRWNTNFDDSRTRLRPISNELPLEELLSRFFESIVQTDFENYVVCPYLGTLIHRGAFQTMTKLPDALKDYIYCMNVGGARLQIMSPLCIQDPFELNLNVTKNVPRHDFECLREHCMVASRLSFTVPPHLFLSKLLSTSYKYSTNESRQNWLLNPMHVRPLKGFMTLHVPFPGDAVDEIIWLNDVTQKLILIFKKILKIHAENLTTKQESKPGCDQNLECKGSQVLWLERDELWKKWHSNLSTKSDSSCRDVQVLDVSETQNTISEVRGQKRKHEGEEREESHKKAKQRNHDPQTSAQSYVVDIIDLDSEDSTPDQAREDILSRSLLDEINLTKEMVKRGHALPAAYVILDFTCKICLSNRNIRIEIADRRSRNNFFASLCVFLEEGLVKFILEE
ncbi:Speckle targeted PIP5K1A-regulated poly(A) polymerase, partial [Frankliniella fusca]